MAIRLLTKEELLGDDKNQPLTAVQAYGKNAAVSDLASLLGGHSFAVVRTCEGQFATDYLTQSSENGEAVIWRCIQGEKTLSPTARYPVVRPVFTPAEMPFTDSPETMYPLPLPDGTQIGVCQYGFYPQKYVGEHLSSRLEFHFRGDELSETGKTYTLPKSNADDLEQPFETEEYPAYRFEDKSYIRIEPHIKSTAYHSLNGEQLFRMKPYWISVDPIEWLMDDTGVLIAKQGLLAGIPLLTDENQAYSGDFRKTVMGEFLRNNFAPEAGIKVQMFEPNHWLKTHPHPTKEDFLSVPDGEEKNTVNLLTEAGIDVLRKAFPSEKWANMNSKRDLRDIFSTVDVKDAKNRLTLRCLSARFEAYYHKQTVLKKEIMTRSSQVREED